MKQRDWLGKLFSNCQLRSGMQENVSSDVIQASRIVIASNRPRIRVGSGFSTRTGKAKRENCRVKIFGLGPFKR